MIPGLSASARTRVIWISDTVDIAQRRAPGQASRGFAAVSQPLAPASLALRYAATVAIGGEAPFAAVAERWDQARLRRAAVVFALACMCVPVLELQDSHSVIESVLASLSHGTWPGVPWRVWVALAWVVSTGVAAGVLCHRAAPRSRMRLFFVCALMHGAYMLAAGIGSAALIGMTAFAASFVSLHAAHDVWPAGTAPASLLVHDSRLGPVENSGRPGP